MAITRGIGTSQPTRPTTTNVDTGSGPDFVTLPNPEIRDFQAETAFMVGQIPQLIGGGGSGAGAAVARQGAQNRLKFGLRGLELQREGLGIDREEAGIARERGIEAAINNALQRGIFRSGIRQRNVERAEELGDLQTKRLDLRGKQIDLSEEDLRASIKNALASINASASAARSARQAQIAQAQWQIEMQRRQQLGEAILGGQVDPTRDFNTRGILRGIG